MSVRVMRHIILNDDSYEMRSHVSDRDFNGLLKTKDKIARRRKNKDNKFALKVGYLRLKSRSVAV